MVAYFVNKDKRVITAKFVYNNQPFADINTFTVLKNTCWNILSGTNTGAFVHDIVKSVLASWGEPIGKAVCHPNDVWDEEKGKQIAKERLLKRWDRLKHAVLWKLNDSIVENYAITMQRLNKKLLK